MICLICRQAELSRAWIPVPLVRGELQLVVNEVPAWFCPYCGDIVLEEEVVVRLFAYAVRLGREGIRSSEIEYARLLP